MTAPSKRRPVTARDFNRLIFALLLLGALTVFARLITRQESRADYHAPQQVTLTQWLQTADALFLRGEWVMAADAYYGALEAAALQPVDLDPRVYKKLSWCLEHASDRRGALHYLRVYQAHLLNCQRKPLQHRLSSDDPLRDPNALAAELARVEERLATWPEDGA